MEANVNSLFADSFTLSWPEYKTMSLEQHKGYGFVRFLFFSREFENYLLKRKVTIVCIVCVYSRAKLDFNFLEFY